MKQRNGPHSSFEHNLSAETASLIEAVSGMEESASAKDIDLTDVNSDDNRIRYILLKEEAATALSHLFQCQYKHRADICTKFTSYSSQMLVRREYRLALTEIYKAALAGDEDSTGIYLNQLFEDTKKEFVLQTGEELPRSVDDVRLGVRTALRMDAGTRARLGAGEKWAGHRLAETTDNPAPMYRSEGGGGNSRRQDDEWTDQYVSAK